MRVFVAAVSHEALCRFSSKRAQRCFRRTEYYVNTRFMRALAFTAVAPGGVSVELYASSGARATSEVVARPGFLGAFFRPVGASRNEPAARSHPTAFRSKPAMSSTWQNFLNIASLGIGWTRMTVSQFLEDGTFHILIREAVYAVPGSVPNEATKAQAVDAEFEAFAADCEVLSVRCS